MQIITALTMNGGTGKTTTAAVLAQAAAFKGKRALAIDIDGQGNLSQALATRAGRAAGNAYKLITGQAMAAECIVPSGTGFEDVPGQGVDVIPAALELATITSGQGSAKRLERALQPIKAAGLYDLVVVDAPASGELQFNALQAATGVIIPLIADSYSLQSLYEMTDVIRAIQKSNRALQVHGVLITKYDGRTRHARQMREIIQETAEGLGLPYLGEVRQCIAVQEAVTLLQSLYKYAPKCTAAVDYMRVYDTITGE